MRSKKPTTPDALKERAAQLRARAQAVENRAREAERSRLHQRKVTLGAWVLARRGLDLAGLSDAERADFFGYLTRPHDRAAWGLPPLPSD